MNCLKRLHTLLTSLRATARMPTKYTPTYSGTRYAHTWVSMMSAHSAAASDDSQNGARTPVMPAHTSASGRPCQHPSADGPSRNRWRAGASRATRVTVTTVA